jgi:hypothetical protein
MKNIDFLFECGQGNFLDTIKIELHNDDPNIFEKLDFDNDYIYSEPLLFSYFSRTNPNISLQQILFGYYPKEKKPSNFKVKSDQKGLIYLPNYGYLQTDELFVELTLIYSNDNIVIYKDKKIIKYTFSPISRLNLYDKAIEVTNRIDLLSQKFFYDWKGIDKKDVDCILNSDPVNLDHYKDNIKNAFLILNQYFENDCSKFMKTTRKIVLFSHAKLRNFAVRESHGTIFLNVNEDSNVCFFLEELIHQCSHIVFNAITYDISDYFSANPYSTLSEYIPRKDDRTLYGALHGVYTTGKIVDLFLKLAKSKNNFDKDFDYEILGRLAININRTKVGLDKAPIDQIFTKEGKELFIFLHENLVNNILNNPSFFKFDMSTHPVVFNYAKFKNDNPIN